MRKIALMARIRQPEGGYIFERVATESKNGKTIQPMEPENAVHYYFRYTDRLPGEKKGKQVMKSAGKSFAEAVKQLRAKEVELVCIERGVAAPAPTESRLTIAGAAEQFHKKQIALDKAAATIYGYKRATDQFRESCFKVHMDEITQQDMLDHINWLRKHVPTRSHGQQNGTIRTRLQYLTAFFVNAGLKNPLPQKQWPKIEERPVEAYTSEQLEILLSKATPDERDLILFFLCTGVRDDEGAHAVYDDINFKAHTIQVRPKPELGFRTKNGKVRDIPVPAELLERMRARRERQPENPLGLIFPNSNGRADTALLYRVRKAAERADFKGRVTLHKFRKAFGTRYAQAHGVRNAQLLLGHESVVTTEKYLAKTRIARPAVEELFEDVVGK